MGPKRLGDVVGRTVMIGGRGAPSHLHGTLFLKPKPLREHPGRLSPVEDVHATIAIGHRDTLIPLGELYDLECGCKLRLRTSAWLAHHLEDALEGLWQGRQRLPPYQLVNAPYPFRRGLVDVEGGNNHAVYLVRLTHCQLAALRVGVWCHG